MTAAKSKRRDCISLLLPNYLMQHWSPLLELLKENPLLCFQGYWKRQNHQKRQQQSLWKIYPDWLQPTLPHHRGQHENVLVGEVAGGFSGQHKWLAVLSEEIKICWPFQVCVEKFVRLVLFFSQAEEERNYHIFYQLCASSSLAEFKDLSLCKSHSHSYLWDIHMLCIGTIGHICMVFAGSV